MNIKNSLRNLAIFTCLGLKCQQALEHGSFAKDVASGAAKLIIYRNSILD
jgi:hypothetical protein